MLIPCIALTSLSKRSPTQHITEALQCRHGQAHTTTPPCHTRAKTKSNSDRARCWAMTSDRHTTAAGRPKMAAKCTIHGDRDTYPPTRAFFIEERNPARQIMDPFPSRAKKRTLCVWHTSVLIIVTTPSRCNVGTGSQTSVRENGTFISHRGTCAPG